MAGKPKGTVTDGEAISRLTVLVLGLALLALIVSRLGGFVESASSGGTSAISLLLSLAERFGLIDLFYAIRVPFIIVSFLVSVALFAGIIYANRRRAEIRKQFNAEMKLLEQKLAGDSLSNKNARWDHVLELASSDSPGDWRVAIIEADSMLEELLSGMSYHGTTLGDKLKAIEPSDFRTLDSAWEAHKVRNHIAHSGSNFILTQRETKRVIELYKAVFQEFDYI